ncbi:subtilisin-like protease SBT5.4 [Andrographis paniculata]|uniref:subtilisin-like protease SBT5.4 n=1 Tax=Andrographis paniculata TaxID=175694 RepID=UPI0021E7B35C|nr:subtilisin-like protease SBT5.4 [Andrographis paniculata]
MLDGKFKMFLAMFILFAAFGKPALAIKKSYIVYMGGHSHGPEFTDSDLAAVIDSHTDLLASFLGSHEKANDAMIHLYTRYVNGFAAILEEEEAAKIADHPDVVSVFPDQGKKLHTTYSWDFLVLEKNGRIPSASIWNKARFGEDTIIANMDTGVWPESASFSGNGYGPIPAKWNGICDLNDKTGRSLCNRKLIGARYFNKGYAAYVKQYGISMNATHNTPRDMEGHGTHTLSTAGGNFVPGASVFGVGVGTSKGGSPRARVAAYRVCFPEVKDGECFDSDILQGLETAIHDGVDVISMSLGGDPADYFADGIAIGTFHAVKNGRVVVASAGNSGPSSGTVSNVAPWIITVGASTIDRVFKANVKLATGLVLEGTSLSKSMAQDGMHTLISGADAATDNVSLHDAILCKGNTLDPAKARGKIVVCLRGDNARVEKGEECHRAGAAGMILCNDKTSGNDIISDPHTLPASHVNYTDGQIIFHYVNYTANPRGILTPPEGVVGVKPAPFMAGFSSRGPNKVTPEILKPDITAPGVNIIASYSEAISPSEMPFDHRRTPFDVMSGTSMSCPHVSGVVGLLKSLYPEWSPGAIRSALMTTSRTRDNTGHPMLDADYKDATPFAYGSGHIRPNRAMDPGLVYDVTVDDYLDFLCGVGYNETSISLFSGTSHNCPANYSVLNFNNPSITVPKLSGSVTVKRTLTNVGDPGKYAARVRSPSGYRVSVDPSILQFDTIGEEKSFTVTITASGSAKAGSYQTGHLTWTDGSHYVRSPVLVASH